MANLQRRHRAWIAFALIAAAVLGTTSLQAGAYFAGVCGIALLYGVGICRTQRWLAFISGAALLAFGIWRLSIQPPLAVSLPAAVAAALLIGAPSVRIVGHFLAVPNSAVRTGCVLGSLLIVAYAVILFAPWPAKHAASLLCLALLAMVLVATEHLWRRWIRGKNHRESRLSVMLICFNEADRIERCLERLSGWADEIVIVDSGSTDGTVEIARRYTDRVIYSAWAGFGRQKQFALEQCTGDWVLNLDADEYIDDPLKKEIDAWLSSDTRYRAFRICWVSMVFSKPVFFGADGRYHKRLFRREGARFDLAEVHEDVLTTGPVTRLGSPVVHDTFRDYAHLKSKFTRYALISADRIRDRSGTAGPLIAFIHGLAAFLILYFRRLGVLDGRRGLLMAMVYAVYTFDKYAAAWADNH